MNATIFLCMLASLLLAGCSHQSKPAETAELDSLSTRCYALVQELNTDELRRTANEYLAKAPKGSKPYFEARLFYINSFFNEKDYPRTLKLLAETMEDAALKRFPASYANYTYTEARCHQFSRQYPEAIAAYRRLLDIEPDAGTDASDKELLYKLHVGAMMQTMYSYYFAGKTKDGFQALGELDRECPPYIAAHYRRDLLAVFSYAAFLANKADTARILIDQALALPTYKDSRENRCRDYNFAAEIYRLKESDLQTAIHYFEESLRISQEDQSIPGEQYVMTTLGYLYNNTGEYLKSIRLYKTAIDVARRRNDPNAVASAYLGLSDFYRLNGLTDESVLYADEGFNWALTGNNQQQIGSAFRQKATIYSKSRRGLACSYLDSAAVHFEQGQLEQDWLTTQLLKARYLVEASSPDSITAGIDLLHSLAGRNLTDAQKASCQDYLFVGFYQSGQTAKAYELAKEVEQQLSKTSSIESQHYTLQKLIDLYTREDKPRKVMELTARWRPVIEAKYKEDVTRSLAAAHIQYQTEQQEQQLRLLKTELRVKQLSIAIYITLIFILLSVIAWGYIWWQHRKKQLRQLFEQLIRRHLEWQEMNQLAAGEEVFILPGSADIPEETTNAQQIALYHRVLAVMQKEKPFLDPAFDLNMLARHVGTNRTMLSTTLNRETGMNFNNWLAEYRVNFLIEQLPLHADKTVNELFPLVGFSSRTSFFRQFRQVTGMTPSQYMAQLNIHI